MNEPVVKYSSRSSGCVPANVTSVTSNGSRVSATFPATP